MRKAGKQELKAFDPSDHPVEVRPAWKKPKGRCGCGRAALWPRFGECDKHGKLLPGGPVFYSRLCGYRVAVKSLFITSATSSVQKEQSP